MRGLARLVTVLSVCTLASAVACRQPNPPAPTTSSVPPTTRLTTTSGPAPTTRPAPPGSLAWITGSNGANGIFDQASINAWNTFSGRRMQLAMVATSRSSWANITGRTYAQTNYTDPDLILDTAQPMWPEKSGGSHAACRSGAYDAEWKKWGATVNATRNPIITRLGWEMNGDWWEWSAHNAADYVACFQRIVTAVRSVAPGAVFEWNINGGWSQTCGGDALTCYPGDAYVDIVSIDYYDQWPPSKTDAEFTTRAEGKGGITWIWNFAVAHNKRFGVGEWGVVSTGGNPGGDNPVFVENMQRWFRDHVGRTRDRWLYEAYFNIPHEVGSALINPATNPRAAKAYVDCRFCH